MRSAILVAFVILALWSSSAQAQTTLPVLTVEWPPLASSSQDRPGCVLEFVTEAFALSGIGVRYDYESWPRNFIEIGKGRYFAATPYTKTGQRAQQFHLSAPFFKGMVRVFYNKSILPDYDYAGVESLRPYRVAVLKGWYSVEEWSDLGLRLEIVKKPEQAFQMLALGRVDLFVFDHWSGQRHVREMGEAAKDVAMSQTPVDIVPVHLLVSRMFPGAEQYVKIFNENIPTLLNNGTVERLAAKYDVTRDMFILGD